MDAFNDKRSHLQELQYALRLKKNKMDLIWCFRAKDDITSICQIKSAPFYTVEKQIILGSRDHTVYSLSEHKKILWTFSANDEITGLSSFTPANSDSELIVASSLDSFVYVLNGKGQLLWSYSLTSGVTSVTTMTINTTDSIIAGTMSGSIYVLSYQGKVLWEYACGTQCIIKSICISAPGDNEEEIDQVQNKTIIAATNKGEIAILDVNQRQLLHKIALPDKSAVYSVLSKDIDRDGHNEIIISSDSCVVYMLDYYGRQKWQFQTQDSVYSVHCCDINHDNSDEIVVGTKDNRVYVLNAQGEFMWEYKTEHNIWSIYVSSHYNPHFYDIFTSLSNKTVNYYKLIDMPYITRKIENSYKRLFTGPEEELKLLFFLCNYEDEYLRGFARARIIHFSKNRVYREKIFRMLKKGMHDTSPIVRDESIKALIRMFDFEFDRSIHIIKEILVNEHDSEIRNDSIVSIINASLRMTRINKKVELYMLINQLGLSWNLLEHKQCMNLFAAAKDDLMTGNYQEALENFEILSNNKIDMLWKFTTAGYVSSVIAHDIDGDGYEEIILSSRGNRMYVLDYKGVVKWEIQGHCHTIVLLRDREDSGEAEIIAVYADGTMQIYNAAGKKKEAINLHIAFNITNALLLREHKNAKTILLLCNDESLRIFHLEDHTLKRVSGVFSAYTLYAFDSNGDHKDKILLGTRFGEIHALDEKGHALWQWPGRDDSPVVAIHAFYGNDTDNMLIIVGHASGLLCAFNRRGDLQWEYSFNTAIHYIVTADFNNDGILEIVVGIAENNLYIFDHKGQLEATVRVPAHIRCISSYRLYHDNLQKLLLGCNDEALYCYSIMAEDELLEFIQKSKNHLYSQEVRAHFDRVSIFKSIKTILERKSPPHKIILRGFWGAGKSEILWKINTGHLGEQYITALFYDYNYLQFKSTHSFMHAFIDIVGKNLKKKNITVLPSYNAKANDDFDRFFTVFLENTQRTIPEDQKVLLLLDDFHLLEAEIQNGVLDNEIFDYFNRISATNRFTFIIVVPPEYLESSTKSESHEFLFLNSETIDVNFLPRDEAERGLAHRLSEYMGAYDELVEKIITVSGCHTFLMQVMLSEAIKYIQMHNVVSLTHKDMDIIIENVLPRAGSALESHWNSSDCYGKLVFAALAIASEGRAPCQEIRSHLGAFGNLITDEKLSSILKHFTFKKILTPQFTEHEIEYSFSIPLFLLWIRHNHTLLDIINEYSIALLKDVPIKQFIKFDCQLKAERKCDLFFESIHFDLKRWGVLINFCKKWIALTEKKKHRRGKIVDMQLLYGLVKFCAHIFGFTVLESQPIDDLTIFYLETPIFRPKKLQEIMMICFHKINLDERDFNNLISKISNMGEAVKVFLILTFSDSPQFSYRCRESKLDLVVLTSQDIVDIIFSKQYLRALIDDVILNQVSIIDISPYETQGPAINMFFGRIKEIKTVLQHPDKCFAIIGSRRLGKTSLMFHIRQQIMQNKNFRTLYIDCIRFTEDSPDTLTRFCRHVLNDLDIRDSNLSDIKDFTSQIIKFCTDQQVQLILFLDEIDGMLALDRKYKGLLFKVLKALYIERHITLIIAGYEELYFTMRDLESPLFNLCEVIRLTPLDKDSAVKLITEPIQELGIEFEEYHTIVKTICNVTSCFPNLIQELCGQLIKLIGSKNKRVISLPDVTKIIEMPEFQDTFIDMFFKQLSDLGQLIVLLVLDMEEFAVNQIDTRLRAEGIWRSLYDITDELDKIILNSLMKKSKTRYSFRLSAFPSIFKNAIPIDIMLRSLKRKLQTPPPS
ncbi:MAG: PQQ-binding-like beta-propeller repeat protein [bacterium]